MPTGHFHPGPLSAPIHTGAMSAHQVQVWREALHNRRAIQPPVFDGRGLKLKADSRPRGMTLGQRRLNERIRWTEEPLAIPGGPIGQDELAWFPGRGGRHGVSQRADSPYRECDQVLMKQREQRTPRGTEGALPTFRTDLPICPAALVRGSLTDQPFVAGSDDNQENRTRRPRRGLKRLRSVWLTV